MSQVVHCRKASFDIYVGRKYQDMAASKWANPYVIGKDGTRAEVIAKYETYLRANEDLMAALPELEGKVLGCWCKDTAPGDVACHGDVLVRLLDQVREEAQEAKEAEGEATESVAVREILARQDEHMMESLTEVAKPDVLACFSSHYSLNASSILSLEEAGKIPVGGYTSIVDLARHHHLKQVTIVDDRLDGILEAWRNLSKPFKPTPPTPVDQLRKVNDKLTVAEAQEVFDEATAKYAREKEWSQDPIQLIFGLKLTVVPDMAQKDAASELQESNVIVFMKDVTANPEVQSPSYADLVAINNAAWTTGWHKGRGRIDWATLKRLWTPNLVLALPFFSSFIQRNTLTFATIVPDLPCAPWVFKEVDSELPFAHLIDEAVDHYVKETGCAVQQVKSIYYEGAGKSTFREFSVMKARANHGTFSNPRCDNMASDRFSFQAYQDLIS